LDEFATSIKFKSNRFSFATGVASKLDAIVSVMKNFEKAKFSVEGYTDSVGAASYNQKLSVNLEMPSVPAALSAIIPEESWAVYPMAIPCACVWH